MARRKDTRLRLRLVDRGYDADALQRARDRAQGRHWDAARGKVSNPRATWETLDGRFELRWMSRARLLTRAYPHGGLRVFDRKTSADTYHYSLRLGLAHIARVLDREGVRQPSAAEKRAAISAKRREIANARWRKHREYREHREGGAMKCDLCAEPLFADLGNAAINGPRQRIKVCSRCWWMLPAGTREAVRYNRAVLAEVRHALVERRASVATIKGGRHTPGANGGRHTKR